MFSILFIQTFALEMNKNGWLYVYINYVQHNIIITLTMYVDVVFTAQHNYHFDHVCLC